MSPELELAWLLVKLGFYIGLLIAWMVTVVTAFGLVLRFDWKWLQSLRLARLITFYFLVSLAQDVYESRWFLVAVDVVAIVIWVLRIEEAKERREVAS